MMRNPDSCAAQVLDARQGEAPAAGPRLPSRMLRDTEWLVRIGALAEETGLLHGPGLAPPHQDPLLSSCLWRRVLSQAFPSVYPLRFSL